MKRIFYLGILSTLALTACQKEVDDIVGGGGGSTGSGTQLVKTTSKGGSDSTATTIAYNSSGKIVNYDVFAINSGQTFEVKSRFVRNSAGIIQQKIVKSPDLATIGLDSLVYMVGYDATTSRYKSLVNTLSLFGFTIRDSTAYTYDASGKLITEIHYMDQGGGYKPTAKTEYTYSGNNVLTQKDFAYDAATSNYSLDDTYSFEYDSKTSPLQFASDAPILGNAQFYPANNVTKATLVSLATPSTNSVSTYTYTYNSNNRPVSATATVAGTPTTASFFYQ